MKRRAGAVAGSVSFTVFGCLVCCSLLVVCAGCATAPGDGTSGAPSAGADAAPTSDTGFVAQLLDAVPEPAAGRFSEPELVVRFLLEQVKARNVDEAARVFPVKEFYRKATLEAYAKRVGMINFGGAPLPGADLHNFLVAARFFAIYDRLSFAFLGLDMFKPQILEDEKEIQALAGKLDAGRLAQLEIVAVEREREIPLPSLDNTLDRALGVTDRCIVRFTVRCGGKEETGRLVVIKIDTNWRVESVFD